MAIPTFGIFKIYLSILQIFELFYRPKIPTDIIKYIQLVVLARLMFTIDSVPNKSSTDNIYF